VEDRGRPWALFVPGLAQNSLARPLGLPPTKDGIMAKSQKKSNRETRKPKADKAPKQNASQPSQKAGVVKGLENIKN
jgi:hypothetical protein